MNISVGESFSRGKTQLHIRTIFRIRHHTVDIECHNTLLSIIEHIRLTFIVIKCELPSPGNLIRSLPEFTEAFDVPVRKGIKHVDNRIR